VGTNGKTTSTYLMKSILESAGFKVGLIGTIVNLIGSRVVETHNTTPGVLELQKLFAQMVQDRVEYVIMEVYPIPLLNQEWLDSLLGLEFSPILLKTIWIIMALLRNIYV
jgi:UDP-N-acetylmuramoyl-L-alanyl-D-glutamate--2,6-diaminopimelate ligase